MKTLLRAGTATLGGARPKASVQDGDDLSIAKFPHPQDDWDVMAWEKTTLDLADRAGIAVPPRRLEPIDGRSVLIVGRFDRPPGAARLGYISALTLVNGSSSAGHDYLDLAADMADHCADPDADLLEMWRRVAFSVAVHNTDDHLRNHGFLRGSDGWRLSPAFDINPNPELGEHRATAVHGVVDPRDEVAGLRACAEYFGVSRRGADVVIAQVRDAVADWKDVARSNGVDHEIHRFAPMFEAMDARLREA